MLSVRDLNTEYATPKGPPVRAAQHVSFEVPPGKFFTLLGPSGCGKTTTLRSIAGLERPVSGEISVGSRVVYSSRLGLFVPPNKRQFGMVFQSYAIWPHMSVFANVAFPLEVRQPRDSRKRIHASVMAMLEAVGLEHLAQRDSTKLSGGQQQRLALARALVMKPDLLLLDEPLSNLDAKLRERMRFELKRIQRDHGLTTIYVTHDQGEALALSDEIAVMSEGRIVQIGAPRIIYNQPRNRFVADFIGTTNFVLGEAKGFDAEAGRWRIDTPLGDLLVQKDASLSPGDRVTIAIRPEDIALANSAFESAPALNAFPGRLEVAVFLGDAIDVQVGAGGVLLQARAHPSLLADEGDSIHVGVHADRCMAIKDETRAVLCA